MPDLNTPTSNNPIVNNNSQVTPSNSNSANLSPWEEDLDLPEENQPLTQPVIGTLYDSKETQQAQHPVEPVQLNMPNQPVQTVGETIPASNFVPENLVSVPAETPIPVSPVLTPASTPELPSQVMADIVPKSSENRAENPLPPININDRLLPEIETDEKIPQPETVDSKNQVQLERAPEYKPSIFSAFLDKYARNRQSFVFLGSLLILAVGAIVLTEVGSISIGAERVYGAIGLERLWGGLPKNINSAFFTSFSKLSSEQTFKVRGNITITVNKSVDSPILTPIVGKYGFSHFSYDSELPVMPLQGIKTATTDYDTIINGTTDQTLNLNSFQTDPMADSLTNSNDLNSNQNIYDDQTNYPSYQAEAKDTQDVYADITGSFSPSGNESLIKIKKVVGTADIEIKNSNVKIWVKSDEDIKFAENASPEKWLEYDIQSFEGNSAQAVFFSTLTLSDLSVSGKRADNVLINNDRCYKYDLTSVSLGKALTSLGMSENQIKSMTGSVYLGIKDRLPKRLALNIAGDDSTSASMITLAIDFYDYGSQNSFSQPAESDIVVAVGPNANGQVAATTTNANDTKRKTNLASIGTALESYKSANGSYPLAAALVKLNTTANILQTSLVPSYLSALPADPKDSEGWYYGYKSSDGKGYSLSTRLEDSSDTSGVTSNGVTLYEVTGGTTVPAIINTGDLKRKSDLFSIKAALIQYYADNNAYPISSSLIHIGGTNVIKTTLVPRYIASLPEDTKSGWYYGYKSTDGQSFTLSARLESTTDTEARNIGGTYLYFLYNE